MKQTEATPLPEAIVWNHNRWGKVIGTKGNALIVEYESRNRRKASAKLQREINLFTTACGQLH